MTIKHRSLLPSFSIRLSLSRFTSVKNLLGWKLAAYKGRRIRATSRSRSKDVETADWADRPFYLESDGFWNAGFSWPVLLAVALDGNGLLRCSFSCRLAARTRKKSAPIKTIAPIAARVPDTAARAIGGTSTAIFIRFRISSGSSSIPCNEANLCYWHVNFSRSILIVMTSGW